MALSVIALGAITLFLWQGFARRAMPEIPHIDFNGVAASVQRAIKSAQRVVAAEPRSATAWGRLGMVLLAHEYFAESRMCFEVAKNLDPAEFRWPYLQGVVLEPVDVAASAAAYREAMARGPDMSFVRIRLVELQLKSAELDAAELLLKPLAEKEKDDPRVQFRMAQLQFRRGELAEADSRLKVALRLAPDRQDIQQFLMQLKRARGEYESEGSPQPITIPTRSADAAWPDPILEQVAAQRRDPQWRAQQADRLLAAGHIDEGIKELEQAAAEAADDWTLQAGLIRAYMTAGRREDAERLTEVSIKKFPRGFDFYRLRGSLHLLRDRWNDAMEDYRQALRLKPDDAESHADLGFCLQQVGQSEGAKSEFTKALRLDGSLTSTRIQLAKLLIEQDDAKSAAVLLQEGLQVHPDNLAVKLLLEQALRHTLETSP